MSLGKIVLPCVKNTKTALDMMSKEEYVALALSRWPELESLDQEKDFYEYEKRFEQIMLDLSRAVLESKISKVGKDRRKKQNPDTIRRYRSE